MCWLCLYSTAKCFKRSHHLNARCACQLPRDVLFLVECFSSFPLGVGRQTFHHTQVPWLHQRQSQVLRRMRDCTSGPPPHIIRVSFVFPAVDGELNFGGVDSAHYTGVFAYTNFESTSEWAVLAKNFLAIKSTESFPSLVCLACNTRDISFAKLGKLLLLPLASKSWTAWSCPPRVCSCQHSGLWIQWSQFNSAQGLAPDSRSRRVSLCWCQQCE